MPNRRRSGKVKKRLTGERGFTLIEIMVAVLLLLFAMAGIVPFFLGGLSQASTVRYKSIATNIARERIEQIRQLDYREITEDPDEGMTLTERYGSTAEYASEERPLAFDVSYAVEESIYDSGILKRVTVNVAWDAPPALSAASITTMIHQQFLGPRGSLLEVSPVSPDPLGSPFSLIAGTTKVRYHIAESDWGLLFSNLDPASLVVRDGVYMILGMYDDAGQSAPDAPWKVENSPSDAPRSGLRCRRYRRRRLFRVQHRRRFDPRRLLGIARGRLQRVQRAGQHVAPAGARREQRPLSPPRSRLLRSLTTRPYSLTWMGGSNVIAPTTCSSAPNGTVEPGRTRGPPSPITSMRTRRTTPIRVASEARRIRGVPSRLRTRYQYRLCAVDICEPGKEGTAATPRRSTAGEYNHDHDSSPADLFDDHDVHHGRIELFGRHQEQRRTSATTSTSGTRAAR